VFSEVAEIAWVAQWQGQFSISCFDFHILIPYDVITVICIIQKSWISLERDEIWQKGKRYSSSLLKAFQIRLFFKTSIFHFIGTLILRYFPLKLLYLEMRRHCCRKTTSWLNELLLGDMRTNCERVILPLLRKKYSLHWPISIQ